MTDSSSVTIKKYANRRLYHTGTSSYITLDDLATMVQAGESFVVIDAKSEEDITRSVLTQIIFEQENKGDGLFPIDFLRRMIEMYGDGMRALVPSLLNLSLQSFSEKRAEMAKDTPSEEAGLYDLDAVLKNNMKNMQSSMSDCINFMFKNLQNPGRDDPICSTTPSDTEPRDNALEELRDRLEVMQNQIDSLTRAGPGSRKPRNSGKK